MAEKKRQTKTTRQRAEEEVARLERRHGRLMAKRRAAQEAVTAFDPEIRDVEAELEHARAHPALPPVSQAVAQLAHAETQQDPSTTDTTED